MSNFNKWQNLHYQSEFNIPNSNWYTFTITFFHIYNWTKFPVQEYSTFLLPSSSKWKTKMGLTFCMYWLYVYNQPCRVFRLPSAPTSTSNSYSLAGWSGGDILALQPLPKMYELMIINNYIRENHINITERLITEYWCSVKNIGQDFILAEWPADMNKWDIPNLTWLFKVQMKTQSFKRIIWEHILSDPSAETTGSSKSKYVTPGWISTPTKRATFSRIHSNARIPGT